MGERLAGHPRGGPKAFVTLGGTALLVHSARVMASACAPLVVVVAAGHVEHATEMLSAEGLDAAVCVGGATRTDSVAAGLRACHRLDLRAQDLIGIHDAARPFVTRDLVERVFDGVTSGWDAVAPGLPVVDTLKLVGPSFEVQRTVDRQGLWSVQTPQAFRWAVLAQAYARLSEGATDDLALVERSGGRIRLVHGDPFNFKVTYPRDLALAEALLAQRLPGLGAACAAPEGGDPM